MAPTVLNKLADVPHQCHVVKDLIMDVSVSKVLKGLLLLHFTLWLLRDVCFTGNGFLSTLSGSGGGNLSVYSKGLAAV